MTTGEPASYASPPPPPLPQKRDADLAIGYILWIFGFLGAHRFYYGRPLTGTLWFFTGGLLGIGWIVDAFLIPSWNLELGDAPQGPKLRSVAWILLVFLGLWGVHRFYLGRWISGLVYFFTAGLFGFGYIYDLWTLNDQIRDVNRELTPAAAF